MIYRPVTHRVTAVTIGALIMLSYAIIVGGTAHGEVVPWLRALNALLSGVVIAWLVTHLPRSADKVSNATIIALLLFCIAALLSEFPRQSFDAALGALTYAAAFLLGREVLASESARRAMARTLMGLSAFITIATAARWLPQVIEWWALTDFTVMPPLDLSLSAAPWGHRHDLALLIVMLYPSWWIGRPNPLRAALGTVIGILTVLIVVVDGSRTLWLAIVVATAVWLLPISMHRLQTDGRSRIAAIVGTLAFLALSVTTGLAATVLDRLLTVSTVGARSAMWAPLTDLWLQHPIAGVGPGSFPWALQLTDYFDTNGWAPRHPDSVLFQLLPEAGLLGVAAVVTVVATLVPALLRARIVQAQWALVVFAAAGIGASPTDFGFLVATAIAWSAYAVPIEPNSTPLAIRTRWPGAGLRISLGVIGVAYGVTVLATFAYESGRNRVNEGRLEAVAGRWDAAVALDPNMALYSRQRGALRLLNGDRAGAINDLSRSVAINPTDDLGWRTLALAHAEVGDQQGADRALEHAISAQRSDPTNLLLLAHLQLDAHDPATRRIIAEIVQAWPSIALTPNWSDFLPPSFTAQDATALAIQRWQQGMQAPQPVKNQPLLLVALADRTDLSDDAITVSPLSAELAAASLAVHRCDPSASALLELVSESDRRSQEYWGLVLTASFQRGEPDTDARRLYEIMIGRPLTNGSIDSVLNPLRENNSGGFSADAWGYRREPIAWPAYSVRLPSPSAGNTRWRLNLGGSDGSCGLEE
jgi:O-antigen ligase